MTAGTPAPPGVGGVIRPSTDPEPATVLILRAAFEAIQAAGIPHQLREVAFTEAVRLIVLTAVHGPDDSDR